MTAFNVNYNVKVKLTDVGLHELKKQHIELQKYCPSIGDFNPPTIDENGYSTFQLWCLMRKLGHLCRLGHELPFDTEIILIHDTVVK